MKAFHNDPKIKNTYLNRILAHQKADEIQKGFYWEKGKGCAVGCTIHGSDHREYETQLGIPQWLARLEDRIFEGLPNARAKEWPVEFLNAIPIGVDLQKIFIPMLIFIVESARKNTKNKKSLAAVDGVLVELKKETIDYPALEKARNAAVAYAVAAAAAAVAYAVAAAAAAVAYAVAAAAAAVAYAVAAAAAAVAKEKRYVKFADKLLELMAGVKS